MKNRSIKGKVCQCTEDENSGLKQPSLSSLSIRRLFFYEKDFHFLYDIHSNICTARGTSLFSIPVFCYSKKRNSREENVQMAGHSKWNNIKRRKGAQDAKRGKIFMRHAKDIYNAAKQGGGDISMNAALRLAVDKAKADNMPNDNIERNIKKATGSLDGKNYEEITYEGYGPGGVAIIVQTLTDNKNRTAGEVRHAFSKNGGNLGENGSVSFMFDRKGIVIIANENGELDEDEITLEALEAGADDIIVHEDAFEIITSPDNFSDVVAYFTESAYEISDSELTLIPQNYSPVSEEDAEKLEQLIDMLEDSEDVQEVYHNLDESNEG